MGIQLIISGEHSTDLLAELQTISTALTGGNDRAKELASNEIDNIEEKSSDVEVADTPDEPANLPKPTKLTGIEHKREADKMIASGEVDLDIFNLLSKNQRERVTKALSDDRSIVDDVVVDTVEEDTVDNVEESIPVTTVDDIKTLINKVGRDENGNDDPSKYAHIRNILRDAIPEGQEIRVSSIPQYKLRDVYESLGEV